MPTELESKYRRCILIFIGNHGMILSLTIYESIYTFAVLKSQGKILEIVEDEVFIITHASHVTRVELDLSVSGRG